MGADKIMKKVYFFLLLSVHIVQQASYFNEPKSLKSESLAVSTTLAVSQEPISLSALIERSKILPSNRSNMDLLWKFNQFDEESRGFFYEHPCAISKNEFESTLDAFIAAATSGSLRNPTFWSEASDGELLPHPDFFDAKQAVFYPFAQKIIGKPNDIFFMHGDLHGDITSLLQELKYFYDNKIIDDNFRIVQPNAHIVFLGDYVDRGMHGTEVIYTIMRLYLANPDGNVIAVRGNHEDVTINSSFSRELQAKFKADSSDLLTTRIAKFYELLPMVLYVGCKDESTNTINYVQCCHGGLEEDYAPQLFLDNENSRFQLLGKMPDTHASAHPQEYGKDVYGFMWGDFDPNKIDPKKIDPNKIPEDQDLGVKQFNFRRGAGYIHGERAVRNVLTQQSSKKSIVHGVIRAHQHTHDATDPIMKGLLENDGIYKLWREYEGRNLQRSLHDGLVWTMNVAPDSTFGESLQYDFDTFVSIALQEKYDNWSMSVLHTTLPSHSLAFKAVNSEESIDSNPNDDKKKPAHHAYRGIKEEEAALCFNSIVAPILKSLNDKPLLLESFVHIAQLLEHAYLSNSSDVVKKDIDTIAQAFFNDTIPKETASTTLPDRVFKIFNAYKEYKDQEALLEKLLELSEKYETSFSKCVEMHQEKSLKSSSEEKIEDVEEDIVVYDPLADTYKSSIDQITGIVGNIQSQEDRDELLEALITFIQDNPEQFADIEKTDIDINPDLRLLLEEIAKILSSSVDQSYYLPVLEKVKNSMQK